MKLNLPSSVGIPRQADPKRKLEKTEGCYHHRRMRAQTIGRFFGVGLRVAGRMAGQRIAASGSSTPRPANPGGGAQRPRISAQQAARAGGSISRGLGGFVRPFARVGHSIFLEVTGVFFLLFVLVFGNWAWRLRSQYVHGPEHAKFLVYLGMMLVFAYLAASSFWRARRK